MTILPAAVAPGDNAGARGSPAAPVQLLCRSPAWPQTFRKREASAGTRHRKQPLAHSGAWPMGHAELFLQDWNGFFLAPAARKRQEACDIHINTPGLLRNRSLCKIKR